MKKNKPISKQLPTPFQEPDLPSIT